MNIAIIRKLHRLNALLLATFLLLHITNHLVLLWGADRHIAVMAALRHIYRNPMAEWLLLLSIIVQLFTGVTQFIVGWKARRGTIAWLQAISGGYLALFLLNHVGAVMYARSIGVDTNIYFAAAGIHVAPYAWFFVPYYGLAVTALFTHVGCALYWANTGRGNDKAALRSVQISIPLGISIGVTLVLAMAGWLVPITIPDSYLAALR